MVWDFSCSTKITVLGQGWKKAWVDFLAALWKQSKKNSAEKSLGGHLVGSAVLIASVDMVQGNGKAA